MIEIRSDERSVRVLTTEPDPNESASFVESRNPRRKPVVVLVAILAVIVVLLAALDRSVPDAEETSESVEPDRPARPVQPVLQPSDWLSTWPDPPKDHAPIVIGRPALGDALLHDAPGHTLLYVNTIDRPTVVDLAQSRRQELTISPVRSIDGFLVEDGQLVDDDPLNPDLPEAGDRAVPVVVHQNAEGAPDLVGGWSRATGPHLCLDVAGCPGLQRYPSRIDVGTQRIEQIELVDHAGLRAMFERGVTDGSNRFVVVTTPAGEDIRIPVPRPGTTIWLVRDLQ